jgi:geranylgeranyl diphosphate synthase type II
VGLVFQIADDLLDVTAPTSVLGKTAGSDAAAGRATFPAVMGVEPSRALASEQVRVARQVIQPLEPEPGPLAALASYALDRPA